MKLLIDTSVVNAYLDKRQPERMNLTQEFWETLGNHQVLISEITVEEINQMTDASLKEKCLQLIQSFKVLSITAEIQDLAGLYIQAKVIPKSFITDALLIATTSVNSLDILVSWNFKHMVNLKVEAKVNAINALYNSPQIDIAAPGELL